MTDLSAPVVCNHVDHLVVLHTSADHAGTKTFSRYKPNGDDWKFDSGWWVKSFKAGWEFTASRYEMPTLEAVAAVIDEERRNPRSFLVSGELTADGLPMLSGKPRRRLKKSQVGCPATFRERASHLVLIDLDDVPLPDWADLAGKPAAVVDHAIRTYMPEAFHESRCFYHFSSSTGLIPGKLGVHLFYWSPVKVWNAHVKSALRPYAPIVCQSPYNGAQPFFIAAPVIMGADDPLPSRTGWAGGTQSTVTIPPAPEVKGDGRTRHARGSTGVPDFADIDALLKTFGRGAGRGGFHDVILAANWRYAEQCVRNGGRDDAAHIAKMRAAMEAAPRNEGDLAGYPDSYIQADIHAAIAKQEVKIQVGKECSAPNVPAQYDPDTAGLLNQTAMDLFFSDKISAVVSSRQQARRDNHLAGYQICAMPDGPVELLKGGLGGGKTETLLAEAKCYLTSADTDRRLCVLLPDHNLAADVERRFRIVAPDVPVFRYVGPRHEDDKSPGQDMCRKSGLLKFVTDAGATIDLLCGSAKRGYCEYHPSNPTVRTPCGYRTNLAAMPHNGLLLMAGPSAPVSAPGEVLKRKMGVKRTVVDDDGKSCVVTDHIAADFADVLVIDEPKPLSWREDNETPPIKVGALRVPLRRYPSAVWTDRQKEAATAVGRALGLLADGLERLPTGRLTAGVVRSIAALADWPGVRKAAWSLMPPTDDLKVQMSDGELMKIAESIAGFVAPLNNVVKLAGCICNALEAIAGQPEQTLSGFLSIMSDGDGERAVRISGKKDIHNEFKGLPTLMMDATANEKIIERWFPSVTVDYHYQLTTPTSVFRRQVADNQFAYKGWSPKNNTPPAAGVDVDPAVRTVWNNMKWLLRLIMVRAAEYAGRGRDGVDVLVVAPKNTVAALKALWEPFGGVPSGVAFEHYYAIRGVNLYGSVPYMMMVARPQPSVDVLEDIAASIRGYVGVTVADGERLEAVESAYLMSDGKGRVAESKRHPDELAEAIRWEQTEAELIQSDGRPRAGRRDESSPLTIEILTSVPLWAPIDELIKQSDLDPDASIESWMVAMGVAPVVGAKGYVALVAAIDGCTARAVEDRIADNPSRLAPFTRIADNPAVGWSMFSVRLAAEDRYGTACWIKASTVDQAKSVLSSVGLTGATVARAGKPNAFAGMVERGVVLLSPVDALAVYPDLFTGSDGKPLSIEAVKKLFRREKASLGTKTASNPGSAYKDYTIYALAGFEGQNVPKLLTVEYRPKGNGQTTRTLLARADHPDLRTYLENHLGELAYFRVILPTDALLNPAPPELLNPATLYPAPATIVTVEHLFRIRGRAVHLPPDAVAAPIGKSMAA